MSTTKVKQFQYYWAAEEEKYTGVIYDKSAKMHVWVKNGRWHRLDGPAVVMDDSGATIGISHYWIDNLNYSEETYLKFPEVQVAMAKKKLKDILNSNE